MKKITLLTLTGLLGLAMISSTSLANGGDMMWKENLDSLNLSADQKTQINQIFAATRPQVKSLEADMDKNHKALQKLTTTPNADTAKINDVSSKQGNLIGQMIAIKTTNSNKIYTLLTPAQQKQYKKLMADRDAKFKAMMEKNNDTTQQ